MCSNPGNMKEVKTKIDDIKARVVDLERRHPKVYAPLKPLLMDLLDWLEASDRIIKYTEREMYRLKDQQKKQQNGSVTVVVNGKAVDAYSAREE